MAAFGTIAGAKIVASYPGEGTGVTVYVDEHGRRWIPDDHPTYEETCPPLRATVQANFIIPK
jgi:hypothetical protein